MAAKIGILCSAYVNTASYDTPTWLELKCISDWTQNFTWDKTPSDSRASVVKTTVKTMVELSYSGTLKVPKGTDEAYALVKESLLSADSPLDLLILNGSNQTEGAEGFRGWFHCYGGSEDQGLSARLMQSVDISPADPENADEQIKYAVVGDSPGFTITYSDIPNDDE